MADTVLCFHCGGDGLCLWMEDDQLLQERCSHCQGTGWHSIHRPLPTPHPKAKEAMQKAIEKMEEIQRERN